MLLKTAPGMDKSAGTKAWKTKQSGSLVPNSSNVLYGASATGICPSLSRSIMAIHPSNSITFSYKSLKTFRCIWPTITPGILTSTCVRFRKLKEDIWNMPFIVLPKSSRWLSRRTQCSPVLLYISKMCLRPCSVFCGICYRSLPTTY